MYPVVFRLGDVEITSFGVLMAIAAVVGWWMFSRETRISGLPPGTSDVALYGLIAGFLGAKLLWAAEHQGEDRFASLLFARGGLSWYGGLIGGVGTGVVLIVRRHVPLLPVLAAATPALAVGHAIGRIGCFLVGDDYGRPSSLPWAVAFPEGLPPTTVRVHPTQLYEAAFLVVLAWWLMRWMRRDLESRVIVGRYLMLALGFRFALEFIRINERVALGLTMAQWIALGGIVVGTGLLRTRRGTAVRRADSSR